MVMSARLEASSDQSQARFGIHVLLVEYAAQLPSTNLCCCCCCLHPQDVHREAMREAQNIARRDGPRGSLDRMGSGRGMDRGK
jgi:hypothetical protein